MGNMKKTFAVLATFTLGALLLYVTYSQDFFIRQPVLEIRHTFDKDGFVIDTPGCRIPKWNPFDPSVIKLYQKHSGPYYCPGKPSFLVVRPNAVISVDSEILLQYYNLTPSNISCTYKTITRDPGTPKEPTDDKYKISNSQELIFDRPLKAEFLIISCTTDQHEFFSEHLPVTPIKEDVEKQRRQLEITNPLPSEDRLNIVIIGIDSISKLNFIRHFPRTRKYLQETLHAIELHGYNKVGDNTFPNIVPLLSGNFISAYWNESKRKEFLDNVDLIWRHYAEHGYRTMMAEDAPNIATFNYLKKGFKQPAADYY